MKPTGTERRPGSCGLACSVRIGGGLHFAGVGGEIEERVLENLELVVASGKLSHRVMHRLVLLAVPDQYCVIALGASLDEG